MGKAGRLKKAFGTSDMAATEEDFDEAMARAMAESVAAAPAEALAPAAAPAQPDFAQKEQVATAPSLSTKENDVPDQRSAKPTGGCRSRSRSRRRSPDVARGGKQRRSPEGARRGRDSAAKGAGRSRSRSGQRGHRRNQEFDKPSRGGVHANHRETERSQDFNRPSRGGAPAKEKDSSSQAQAAAQVPETALNGRQKAKDAVAKEKEKALLKKQKREKEDQERLAAKEEEKALKTQDLHADIANAGALAVVATQPIAAVADADKKVATLAMSTDEQAAAAAAAAADAAAATAALEARQATRAAEAKAAGTVSLPVDKPVRREKLDEALVKKLFKLLDRSEKNAISKRDVLVALKKHAPVRVLFGLPKGSSAENAGDDLQERINAIQDAFEASSGLGEVAPIFEELSTASNTTGQSFAWESFLAHCQKDGFRARVTEALASLPREHSIGAAFEATYEWMIVPEGASCPAGLEYKMDMASGKTLGRLPRPQGGR